MLAVPLTDHVTNISAALADLAPAVANHLWQSTAFAMVAALLALALRRNHARARYWIWMAASLKFLLPFALLASLGSHFARPVRVAGPQAGVYVAMEDVSEPFVVPSTSIAAAPAVERPRPHVGDVLPLLCVALWLVGFVAVLALWFVRWRRIAKSVRAALPVREGREYEALLRIEQAAGLASGTRSHIELRLSQTAMEPGVFGLGLGIGIKKTRAVLAWPEAISARLDDAQLNAILAHEVCHVRRRDNLTAAIHMLVEAAFWFHPLVWWLGARLLAERERACDEEVLLVCARPGIYAESILKVCEFCVSSPLSCVSGVTGADLKQRVVQIMTERVVRKLTSAKKALLVAAALCAIAGPIALGVVRPSAHQFTQQYSHYAASMTPPGIPLMSSLSAPFTKPQLSSLLPPSLLPAPPTGVGAAGTEDVPEHEQLRFDVASIRPAAPFDNTQTRGGRVGVLYTADGMSAWNATLNNLLRTAYELQLTPEQLIGAPDWGGSERWDIEARVADGDMAAYGKLPDVHTPAGMHRRSLMLQALLAERFKLKVHHETREGTVYFLVVAKGGFKGKPAAGTAYTSMHFIMGGGHTEFHGFPAANLARFFANSIHQPVIDKTGLTGNYDMTLEWQEDTGAAADPGASESSKPSIFTAAEEQLGLKLVPSKGPLDVIVIDHVEKPSVDGAEVPSAMPVALVQEKPAPATTTAAPLPNFAVASIRPSGPDDNMMYPPNGSAENFSARMATVESMIGFAYNIPTVIGMSIDPAHFFLPQAANLIGGPAWVRTDKYDLTAKLDGPELEAWNKLPKNQQQAQLRLMMQALLADRFKLVMRNETREMPVYALVVEKGGPKFAPTAGPWPDQNDNTNPAKPYDNSKPYMGPWKLDIGSMHGRGVTLSDLIDRLWMQRELDSRKILDQTGLTGKYDVTLKWASVDDQKEPDGPSLFTAIQEQLGLKLEPTKAPMDVLVIDHIDKPSPN